MSYHCQINSPCRFCGDREIGCHSTCKSYLDWRSDRETAKNKYYSYIEGIRIDIEGARRFRNHKK